VRGVEGALAVVRSLEEMEGDKAVQLGEIGLALAPETLEAGLESRD
jgi:hypothetical protein